MPPGYMAPAGLGYTGPGGGQRASRSRAGSQGSRASRAGLHIRACSGAVTGYNTQGRGNIPKAPRQPQEASGGLFSWGYVWGGYTSNSPSGNWNVFEQPSTSCSPSSGLSQRPLRFIWFSGGMIMSASMGCNCVMSTA
jgi:hypothetical protein